jgi:hypothetical protein
MRRVARRPSRCCNANNTNPTSGMMMSMKKDDAGEEDAASGGSIDNVLHLRVQLPDVLTEFVA